MTNGKMSYLILLVYVDDIIFVSKEPYNYIDYLAIIYVLK